MRYLVTVILTGLIPVATQGRTLNVPADYATIQNAVDASHDFDTILVGPGEYVAHVVLYGQDVLLTSTSGREQTIVTSGTPGRYVVEFTEYKRTSAVVSGFTIRGATAAGGIALLEGNTPTITDCIVEDNSGCEGAALLCKSDGATITHCLFRNNYSESPAGSKDVAVPVWIEAENVTISDCVFAYNHSVGFGIGVVIGWNSTNWTFSHNLGYGNSSETYANFLSAITSDSVAIVGNTIVDNHTPSNSPAILLLSTGRIGIRNNIIAFNEGNSAIATDGSGPRPISYNDVYENGGGFIGLRPGVGNIYEDPLFVDRASNDYRLLPSSPCIDAGDPDPSYNDIDGSRNDMGVFPVLKDLPYPHLFVLADEDPARVVDQTPVFTWEHTDIPPSVLTAFELEVGTDDDWSVAEKWATGQIVSEASMIEYAGSPLEDGMTYFARLRVSNGTVWGGWNYLSFYMNTPPTTPVLSLPKDGALCHVTQVVFSWMNASDIEGDTLSYDFELCDDLSALEPLLSLQGIEEEPDSNWMQPLDPFEPNRQFWWRCRSFDGLEPSEWSDLAGFTTEGCATLLVPGEYPDIQSAMDVARDLDTVVLADGVYTGERNRNIVVNSRAVSIRSVNGPENTIIDCESMGNFVQYRWDTYPISVRGLTVRNGLFSSGGGMSLLYGQVTISDCTFESNTSTGGAGALYLYHTDSLEMRGCRFLDNAAQGEGGAISVCDIGPVKTISSCLFARNMAEGGGAVATNFWGRANMPFLNCTFVGNHASEQGSVFNLGYHGNTFMLEACVLAFNSGESVAYSYLCHGTFEATCTDVFGNDGGDWTGELEGLEDVDGNFSANPVFCDPVQVTTTSEASPRARPVVTTVAAPSVPWEWTAIRYCAAMPT